MVTALVGAMAVAGAGSTASANTPAAPPSALDTCVAKYSSPDTSLRAGQQRVRSASGRVLAVGSAGLSVVESTSTSTVGGKTTVSGTDEVRMGDDSDPAALARAYAASGRSVLDDARAAGLSRNSIRRLCQRQQARQSSTLATPTGSTLATLTAGGSIYASVCVVDNSSQVRWEGCADRYTVSDSDASYNYGVDDAFASGEETSLWAALTKGGVRNTYNTSYVDITKASPGSDINDVPRCYEQGFGVDILGFGVSESGTVCPSRWDITKSSLASVPESHRVEWLGRAYDAREALAISSIRVRSGHSTAYSLNISWGYSA